MADAYAHHYANVHRGIYELSEDATRASRPPGARWPQFLGAPSEREIVFVRNATEAINLVAYSWGRANVGKGDRIVTTQLEHHANIAPGSSWRRTGAALDYVAITDDGRLDMDDLRAKLAARPKLVAWPPSATPWAPSTRSPRSPGGPRSRGARRWSMPQAALHMPIDISPSTATSWPSAATRCSARRDRRAVGRRALLDAMPPFMTGGSMIIRVTLEGAEWNEVPAKFEAGTPPSPRRSGWAPPSTT